MRAGTRPVAPGPRPTTAKPPTSRLLTTKPPAAKPSVAVVPHRIDRAEAARRTVRTRRAVAAAATAVVLAAALAIAGLAAGTRAAQPDDLGRVAPIGAVVE